MRVLERFTFDLDAGTGGHRARRTGRSWWALRYTDGHIVHEWDRDPDSPNGHADWARLAQYGKLKHVQAVRLYCPNGRMAELGGAGDQTGRLFQFKIAVRSVGADRNLLAHVIGIVSGTDGQCQLYAWEPASSTLAGPLADNVYHLAYQQVGRLSAEVLGLDDGEGR